MSWARTLTVKSKRYALRGQQQKVVLQSNVQKKTDKLLYFFNRLPPVRSLRNFNRRNRRSCMFGFALIQLICGVLFALLGILTLTRSIRSVCDHQKFEGLWCSVTGLICVLGGSFAVVCIFFPRNRTVIFMYTIPTLIGFLSLLYWLFDLAVCLKGKTEKEAHLCRKRLAHLKHSEQLNDSLLLPDCAEFSQRNVLYPLVLVLGNVYVVSMFALCNQWNE